MAGFDYYITVGADASSIVETTLEEYRKAEKAIEKDKVVFNISANDKELREIIKKINALELNKNIVFEIDEKDFQKKLSELEKLSGKSANSIANTLKKGFAKELGNTNIKELIESELGGGTKTGSSVSSLISKLKNDLSLEIDEGSSYESIQQQISKYEKLKIIIDEIKRTSIRGVKKTDDVINIGDNFSFDIKEFESQYNTFYKNASSYIKNNIEYLTLDIENSMHSLRSNIVKMLSGFGSDAQGDNALFNFTQEIEEATARLEAARNKVKEIQKSFSLENIEKELFSVSASLTNGFDDEAEYDKNLEKLLQLKNIYEELGGNITALYGKKGGNQLSSNIEDAIDFLDVDVIKTKPDPFGLSAAKQEVIELSETLKNLKKLNNSFGIPTDSEADEIDDLKTQVSELESKLKESQSSLDSMSSKYKEQYDVVTQLSNEIKVLKNETENYNEISQKLIDTQRRLEAYSEIHDELRKNLENAQNSISALDGKDVSAEELSHQIQLVDELEKKLAQVNNLYLQQEQRITELQNTINDLQNRNATLEKESESYASSESQYLSELNKMTEKLSEAENLLATQTKESDGLRLSLEGVNAVLEECISKLNQFDFDPLEQAKKQFTQFRDTEDQTHYDKAASYYGLYKEAGGTEHISFGDVDISDQLLSRYEQLKKSISLSRDELVAMLNQKNLEILKTRELIDTLKAEIATLKKEADAFSAKPKEESKKKEEINKRNAELWNKTLEKKKKQKNSNKTASPTSNDSTSTSQSAQSNVDDSPKKKKQTADSSVSSEIDALSRLDAKLAETTNNVNLKTDAFEREQQVVSGVVQSEISDLTALSGWISIILQDIEKISEHITSLSKDRLPNLDFQSFDDFQNSISDEYINKIKELKNLFSSFDTDKMEKISNSIANIKITDEASENLNKLFDTFEKCKNNLSNFPDNAKDLLSSISQLLEKSDELKNLANILSESKSKIDSAQRAAGANQNSSFILNLDSAEVKDKLPVWTKNYGAQIGQITQVIKSIRDTKSGLAESYKLIGDTGKSVTVGKNGNPVGAKASFGFDDLASDSDKAIADAEASFERLYQERSKLNELIAKDVSGTTIIDQLRDQANEVTKALSEAENHLRTLRALKDAGDISEDIYNENEKAFNKADKGSSSSSDKLRTAVEKSSDKENIRIWDEAHAENARIDAERKKAEEEQKKAEEERKLIQKNKEKQISTLVSDSKTSFSTLEKDQSKFNELLAKDISGENVLNELENQTNKLAESLENAKNQLSLLRDAADHGYITEDEYDLYEESYRNASIGSAKSLDTLEKAYLNSERKENIRIWDEAHAENARIDAESKEIQSKLTAYRKNLKKWESLERSNKRSQKASTESEIEDLKLKLDEDWDEILNFSKNNKIDAEAFNAISNYKNKIDEDIAKIKSGDTFLVNADQFSDANTAYKTLIDNVQRYYSLLDKKAQGKNFTIGEAIDFDRLDKQFKAAAQGIDVYGETLDETGIKLKEMFEEQSALVKKNAFESRSSFLDGYAALFSDDNGSNEYKENVIELKDKIEKLKQLLPIDEFTSEDQLGEIIKLNNEIITLGDSLKKSSKYQLADDYSKSTLDRNMANWLQKNTAAAKQFSGGIHELRERLKEPLTLDGLEEIRASFVQIQTEALNAGKVGTSFGQKMAGKFKELTTYLLSFDSFYKFIEIARKTIDIVTELDTALTEMRKVSEEPLFILKEYQKESFDIANTVGTTASQLQNSTADWMRLGENLNKAKKSAQDTAILYNVSEFEDISSATESLIAMSQAYQDLDKIEIIDKLNNIGNNFSISTNDLATALQKSASALMTQGNDIDEAIALITAGNAIGQDSDSTAAGIRTISLRIAGTEEAKKELQELGEDVDDYIVQTASKTDSIIRKYTSVASNNGKGVSVLDDNGNIKNTYDILLEISKIYAEIQEEDKKYGTNRANALVEVLAGKNRSNIVSSILQNGDLLESVYESSRNSDGSAQSELEKYLDSIEGKSNQLKNNLQELASLTIDSEWIKTIVDFLSDAVSLTSILVENAGSFKLILSAITGLVATKTGFGKQKSEFKMPLSIKTYNNAICPT